MDQDNYAYGGGHGKGSFGARLGACTFQVQVALGGPRRAPTRNVLVMEGDHLARRSIFSAGTPSRALYAHATVAEKADEVRRFPEEFCNGEELGRWVDLAEDKEKCG